MINVVPTQQKQAQEKHKNVIWITLVASFNSVYFRNVLRPLIHGLWLSFALLHQSLYD